MNKSSAIRKKQVKDVITRSPGSTCVSVRNVVPTLTSSKRQGLSLNGRC
jgi:hypothetical protein